jgi:hypothetical protein
MARSLDATDLLAGASQRRRVAVPARLLVPNGTSGNDANGGGDAGVAGDVTLRPLTVRDVQRVAQAAKEERVLTSILMVQQALVAPELSVEQVASLPAGLVRFLLGEVNRLSGLTMDEDELDAAVRQPLSRACFVLAREFGWSPAECAELTVGQVLVYDPPAAPDVAVASCPSGDAGAADTRAGVGGGQVRLLAGRFRCRCVDRPTGHSGLVAGAGKRVALARRIAALARGSAGRDGAARRFPRGAGWVRPGRGRRDRGRAVGRDGRCAPIGGGCAQATRRQREPTGTDGAAEAIRIPRRPIGRG